MIRKRLKRNLKRIEKFSAVFNTSVLIVLAKLKYLNDVAALFKQVEVSRAVMKELSARKDEVYSRVKELVNRDVIKLEDVERDFPGLGRGESSTIFVALVKGKVAVLDDRKARRLARDLGITVLGTLALLKRLYEVGKLKESLEELYIKLTRLKFRIERYLFNKIFRE